MGCSSAKAVEEAGSDGAVEGVRYFDDGIRCFDGDGATYRFKLKAEKLFLEVDGNKNSREVLEMEWQPGVIWIQDGTRMLITNPKVLPEIRNLAEKANVKHQLPENAEAADILAMDIAVADDVEVLGSWSFSLADKKQKPLDGFMLFYPGEAKCTHMEFDSGWKALNWSYEVNGRTARGSIDGLGEFSVTFKADGMAGSGMLGEKAFQMTRRNAALHVDADAFLEGTWDLMQDIEPSWVGFVVLDSGAVGYLEYSDGSSEDRWSCTVDGFFVRSQIPGQGDFEIEYSPDGAVGTAWIGSSKYNVWCRDGSDAGQFAV